jgi:hypothetical protein
MGHDGLFQRRGLPPEFRSATSATPTTTDACVVRQPEISLSLEVEHIFRRLIFVST